MSLNISYYLYIKKVPEKILKFFPEKNFDFQLYRAFSIKKIKIGFIQVYIDFVKFCGHTTFMIKL